MPRCDVSPAEPPGRSHGDSGAASADSAHHPPTTTPPSSDLIVYGPDGQPGMMALGPGCSRVLVNAPAGTPFSTLARLVLPLGNAVSLWRYNNSVHAWQAGYFASGGPTEVTTTAGGTEGYAVCVSGPAIMSGA